MDCVECKKEKYNGEVKGGKLKLERRKYLKVLWYLVYTLRD